MVRSPPSPAVAVPVMDAAGFAAAVAAAVAQLQINNAATANVSQNLPSIPMFICDPAKPNGASLWFDQLDSLFRLQPVTDTEKCALVINALDSSTFEKVSRALLPDPIKTCVDYNKLRDKMIGLFDFSVSLFARRYSALNMEWKGPEYESIPELMARIKDAATAFNGIKDTEIETLMLMMSMKHPALESFRMQVLSKLNKQADTPLNECGETMIDSLQTQREQRLPMNASINFVQKKKVQVTLMKKEEGKNGSSTTSSASCSSCGGSHQRQSCRFKDAVCRFCNIKGHIEKACRKKLASQSKSRSHHNVRAVQSYDAKPQINSFHVQQVYQNTPVASLRHMVNVIVNGITLSAQMDDGADLTVMAKVDYTKIGSPALAGPTVSANTANGHDLKLLGSFKSMVDLRGKSRLVEFHVADIKSTLLGTNFFKTFGIDLVMDGEVLCNMVVGHSIAPVKKVEELMDKFKPLFEPGLGCCTKLQVKLQLKKDAKSVFVPARRPSLHAAELIKSEFARLEEQGVLYKVNYSDWAAPCSIVPRKDGRSRLVIDYSTGLNDQLEEPCYSLPLPEDIFSRFSGCTVFSQLDFADAYHQLELDEESQKLTTVSTTFGQFRYKRLGFGIKTAVSDYQEAMDKMLDDSPAASYLDDVLIGSKNVEEHTKHLEMVLARIMEWGFKLNPKKCKFYCSSIRFLGKIIDSSGIHPDPEKIAAIQKMAEPTDVKTLRSFLGLVNFYQSFIPAFREIREPLDDLLKNDAPWSWNVREKAAFNGIKDKLAAECMLTHYDPRLPITVAADASDTGMGGVISHICHDGSEKPIQFFSRSLNAIQRKYSQTEKEGLALITAIKTFHRYLEGRKFTLYTDHKALLAIFDNKKSKPVLAANRLHRWSLFLASYDFDIRYTKTTDFGQADALSRLIEKTKSIPELYEEEEDTVEAECSAALIRQIDAMPVTPAEIIAEYEHDDFAQKLCAALQNDTAEPKFSLVNGVILMNERVYVPANLRPRVLEQLHATHNGVNLTKQLARHHVYWPNITKDIEKMVNSCTACIQLRKTPIKATLASWNKSVNPGDRIHMDFAGPILDKMLLVIVDSCSKWLDVKVLSTASSKTTIQAFERYIADNGLPRVLVTDNGSQFTSNFFGEFCKLHGINHIRSPVYMPQSNGQAERMVDIVKRFVKKNILRLGPNLNLNNCINEFLLGYRSTPSTATPGNISPAMAHLGREIRNSLDLMKPLQEKLYAPDIQMEKQFNSQYGARLRHFNVNDNVWARKMKSSPWFEGRIIARQGSRLYDIIDLNERVHRLHANQLYKRGVALLNERDSVTADPTPSTRTPEVSPVPSTRTSEVSSSSSERSATSFTQFTPPTTPPRFARSPTVPAPRRGTRIRRAPERIQPDASKKSYY